MSLKQRLKSLSAKLMGPALRDVRHRLDRVEARVQGQHPPPLPGWVIPGEPTPRRLLRAALYRPFRPAMLETVQRLDAIDATLGARAERGIWRGGLRGHAVMPDGTPSVPLSQKYGPELAFWEHLIHGEAERLWNCSFFEKARQWQKQRLIELGEWLELAPKHGAGWSGVEAWASTRTAIELGPGPFPAIAMAKWRRAVAVDPIADGYAAEGLLPPEAEDVVFLASQGEHIPLPAGIADLVVIENALDHVSDPAATLDEIRRLLKHDGVVWLLVDLMDYSDEMHPHPFNAERLRAMFAQCGLAPVRERVREDGGCHPQAYGEYRGLLAKVGSPLLTAKTTAPATGVNGVAPKVEVPAAGGAAPAAKG